MALLFDNNKWIDCVSLVTLRLLSDIFAFNSINVRRPYMQIKRLVRLFSVQLSDGHAVGIGYIFLAIQSPQSIRIQ